MIGGARKNRFATLFAHLMCFVVFRYTAIRFMCGLVCIVVLLITSYSLEKKSKHTSLHFVLGK